MKLLVFIVFFTSVYVCYSQTWNQIGPEGGYFKEFTIDPNNNNIIYAGSDDGGGIWKSTDAGASWSLLTSSFPNMTGWKVILDENNANTIYGCDLYGRYGVLKSTDGGSTWTNINSGLYSTYDNMVSGLVVKTTDTLFISTGESATSTPVRPGNGMFKSYDGGLSWVAAGLQGITIPSSGKNDFGTIFAGTEDYGLYYTNDNGTTWITHPDIPVSGTVFEIESKGNIVMVASSEGVLLSTDWGANFVNTGLVGEFNFDACIHKTAPDIELFSSTMTGLKRYSSATSSWNLVTGSYFTDQIIIGITSDGTNVYCSGFLNSPIQISNDGGLNWNQAASSPKATELTDIYVDPLDNNHIMCCLLGSYNLNGDFDREALYETMDGGANWNRIGPDAHALCLTVNPSNSQEFYLGSFAQGVYKTSDGFNTFSQLSPNGVSVADIIVSSTNSDLVLISEIDWGGPTTSIKRSADGGSSFTTVSNAIANRMLFLPSNNDTIFVATNNGMLLSSDNGLTFNPWLLGGEDCRSLEIRNDDLFVGTTDGKLFKITGGVSTNISGSWSTPCELKSIKAAGPDLFIGMNGAEKDTFMVLQGSIWRTSDDGLNWTDVTSDMTSTNIYGNNIIESDGTELYVGTYGGGVFRSSGMNLTSSLDEVKPNENLHLLRIVDIMGRETNDKPNTLLIYIYSDGTTEKVFRVE